MDIKKLYGFLVFLGMHSILFAMNVAKIDLRNQYIQYRDEVSDINEHLPALRKYASESSSVVEIGIRSMVSTWAILQGLSESVALNKSYIGVDLNLPPLESLNMAKRLAEANGLKFQFVQANDMKLEFQSPVDMLFIDSLHTYCHLTYELETFSPHVRKYITLHDTSAPWGTRDDDQYHGDYSEYPAHFDKTKRGLWQAVVDFLQAHPEWTLHELRTYNHGFTVLKRVTN